MVKIQNFRHNLENRLVSVLKPKFILFRNVMNLINPRTHPEQALTLVREAKFHFSKLSKLTPEKDLH